MSKPINKRIWSAFNTYRQCTRMREDARRNRAHYDRRSDWGIAAHDDRYAKQWQRWDRRREVVIDWFRKHFAPREE